MARKLGTKQVEAIVELISSAPGDQYRYTIMGPRESDRAVLVRQEWGSRRPEGVWWIIVGFGGLSTRADIQDAYPNPREFYPHA